MSKMKFIIPIVLVALGAGYKFVLAKPAPSGPPPKVAGEVYVLPKEFLVNLKDGKFAKVAVALVFDHGYSALPVAAVAPSAPEDAEMVTAAYAAPVTADTWSDIPREPAAEASPRTQFVGGGPPPVKPPEGYGTLVQEAVVRAIITDELTKLTSRALMSSEGREKLRKKLRKRFEKETDVKVHEVLITDIAVQ